MHVHLSDIYGQNIHLVDENKFKRTATFWSYFHIFIK